MNKFKLRGFDSNIGDIIKRVEYRYSIEDSSGLLKIELTMYNDIDEVEYFIDNMNKLYRIDEFIVYHQKFKYIYNKGNISKIKMY